MDANIELYELNRSIIEQQGALGEENIADKCILINNFATNTNNKFYMLYGREINYFTVFALARDKDWELETLALGVMECLVNIGNIYSIEVTAEKDAIEIWVKDNTQDLLTCMYLFPYDNGIVRIR
jgi:hypothetical protein